MYCQTVALSEHVEMVEMSIEVGKTPNTIRTGHIGVKIKKEHLLFIYLVYSKDCVVL